MSPADNTRPAVVWALKRPARRRGRPSASPAPASRSFGLRPPAGGPAAPRGTQDTTPGRESPRRGSRAPQEPQLGYLRPQSRELGWPPTLRASGALGLTKCGGGAGVADQKGPQTATVWRWGLAGACSGRWRGGTAPAVPEPLPRLRPEPGEEGRSARGEGGGEGLTSVQPRLAATPALGACLRSEVRTCSGPFQNSQGFGKAGGRW